MVGDAQRGGLLHSNPPRVLVSAVDTNAARHQLQDALPYIVLGASTHELRAEVDRYDMDDPLSRCLKCDNPVEEARRMQSSGHG